MLESKPEPREIVLATPLKNNEYYEEPNIMYEVAKKRLEPKNIVDQIMNEFINDTDTRRGFMRTLRKFFPEILKGIDLRATKEKLSEDVDKKLKEWEAKQALVTIEMKDNPMFKKRRELTND